MAAIEPREAIYRTVVARLEDRRARPTDVDLLNEKASQPQLTPRLRRTGDVRREGTTAQLLASAAADLLAGTDIQNVKHRSHRDCTRLYLDAPRAKNRHWWGCAQRIVLYANRCEVMRY